MENVMKRVHNITIHELLAMPRSITSLILLLDSIQELSEKVDNPKAKEQELLLFEHLFQPFGNMPFYKVCDLFTTVSSRLEEDMYQELLTFTFQRQGKGKLNITGASKRGTVRLKIRSLRCR